ncbi:MAG: hypothetical protein J1F63_09385 [Oscillospiraceae bacterium]|nr:hypothetical protein [Oscillospiraceae bacterium]
MKKILSVILAALLLLAALPALADGGISVVVGGEEISFDQPPIIKDGRTLVPVRGVFEALGCTVSWSEANQQVTVVNGDEEISFRLGSGRYEKLKNGQAESEGQFDVAPQAVNGRTLIPVRDISEAFGFDVEWNEDTGTVVINDADTIKIGILQLVTHPALDAINNGFIDAINDSGLKVYIEHKNAEGDFVNSVDDAEEYVREEKDLILAFSTPSAQAASFRTKDIPILFTAVSQPVEAGLIQSPAHPGGNISGTLDTYPVEAQLQLLRRRAPEARTVVVVYPDWDSYFAAAAKQAEEILTGMGLNVITMSVEYYNTDFNELVASCLDQAQAVYALNVGADFESAGIPTVYSRSDIVYSLVTYDINYYNLGYRTGRMAVRYLSGEVESVGDMPVEQLSDDELDIVVNWELASAMGITPEDIEMYAPGYKVEQ